MQEAGGEVVIDAHVHKSKSTVSFNVLFNELTKI